MKRELLTGQRVDLWLHQLRWQQEADDLLLLIHSWGKLEEISFVLGLMFRDGPCAMNATIEARKGKARAQKMISERTQDHP